MKAIDEELSSLGQNCEQAIYYHLETRFNLNKEEIPNKLVDFTEAIETIFGQGAKILEIRILKNLFKKMGFINLRFQNRESMEFVEYIEAVRESRHNMTDEQKDLIVVI
jgi:hypothetical protein